MKEPNTINEDLKSMFDSDIDRSGQAEALKQMYNSKDIKLKSDVNKANGESEYFANLILLGRLLKCPELTSYAHEVLMVRVSNDRKGREEAVRMIQQVQPDQKKGLFGGIFR